MHYIKAKNIRPKKLMVIMEAVLKQYPQYKPECKHILDSLGISKKQYSNFVAYKKAASSQNDNSFFDTVFHGKDSGMDLMSDSEEDITLDGFKFNTDIYL